MGSAAAEGELWGARAEDWATLQEPAWNPVFEAALDRAGVGHGTVLLDVGCGAGGALMLARARGAEVAGLDAAASLVAIARARLPGARIEIGDMEALPFDDATFDVVTGINAFQFAGDVGSALAEARRVCRPAGAILALTWGPRDTCELFTVTMAGVLALLPPSEPRAPVAIEAALEAADLVLAESGTFAAELAYPDAETAGTAVMAAGATVRAARAAGAATVRAAILRSLPVVTRPDGRVVWKNTFRWWRAVPRPGPGGRSA